MTTSNSQIFYPEGTKKSKLNPPIGYFDKIAKDILNVISEVE